MNGSMHIFLDVENTYNVLNESDKFFLIGELEKIRKIKGLDTVFISFASTLSCEEIMKECGKELFELVKQFPETLKVGPIIGYDGFLYNNSFYEQTSFISKAESIFLFIKREMKNLNLKEVIYADDSPNINAILLMKYLENSGINLYVDIITKTKKHIDDCYLFNCFIDDKPKFLLTGVEALVDDSLQLNKQYTQRKY